MTLPSSKTRNRRTRRMSATSESCETRALLSAAAPAVDGEFVDVQPDGNADATSETFEVTAGEAGDCLAWCTMAVIDESTQFEGEADHPADVIVEDLPPEEGWDPSWAYRGDVTILSALPVDVSLESADGELTAETTVFERSVEFNGEIDPAVIASLDADGDGIPDEIFTTGAVGVDDAFIDSDGDGLPDGPLFVPMMVSPTDASGWKPELDCGVAPEGTAPDADGDGIPDEFVIYAMDSPGKDGFEAPGWEPGLDCGVAPEGWNPEAVGTDADGDGIADEFVVYAVDPLAKDGSEVPGDVFTVDMVEDVTRSDERLPVIENETEIPIRYATGGGITFRDGVTYNTADGDSDGALKTESEPENATEEVDYELVTFLPDEAVQRDLNTSDLPLSPEFSDLTEVPEVTEEVPVLEEIPVFTDDVLIYAMGAGGSVTPELPLESSNDGLQSSQPPTDSPSRLFAAADNSAAVGTRIAAARPVVPAIRSAVRTSARAARATGLFVRTPVASGQDSDLTPLSDETPEVNEQLPEQQPETVDELSEQPATSAAMPDAEVRVVAISRAASTASTGFVRATAHQGNIDRFMTEFAEDAFMG